MDHGRREADHQGHGDHSPERRGQDGQDGREREAADQDSDRSIVPGNGDVHPASDEQPWRHAPRIDGGEQLELIQREEIHSHFGPIPASWTLREYEDIVPGSAREIIDDAMANSRHDREISRAGADAKIKMDLRGQWFAFAICAVLIASSLLILFVLPAPANYIVAPLFGILGAAPVILGFLGIELGSKGKGREDEEGPGSDLAETP